MAETYQDQLEDLSKNVESLRELKSLVLHNDYVYKREIVPALNKLPSDIREETIKQFNHYHSMSKNIITYLWKTHLENKITLGRLKLDTDVKKKIEALDDEVGDELQEELK